MVNGWQVRLNGFAIDGGNTVAPTGADVIACLTSPPQGMGVPGLRVEDVTYPQRDGVRHFDDWYNARIITLTDVTICPDEDCVQCSSARQKAQNLMLAWSRHCDDTELVIFTDCHDASAAVTGADRALIGPYGVIGRPRVAALNWLRGDSGCAVALLRFDAVDHRLYVLDPSGEPGSGEICTTLGPEVDASCRTYPRCYDDVCSPGVSGWTYNQAITGAFTGPEVVDNFGTLCAQPTLTLDGSLTAPTIENVTTGESVTYTGNIGSGEFVVIDTDTGTATDQDGNPVTYLLEGNPRLIIDTGQNTLRLTSHGPSDTGSVEVCFRPAVLTG